MTAPGDSVLIFILLALFVACCGYAAGRVHQRRQLKQDRDEAYRDGYETASDQVFSLAVRSTVPKRATDQDPGRAVRHQGVAPSPVREPDAPESVFHPTAPHAGNSVFGPLPTPRSPESVRPGMPLGFPAPPPPPPNTVAEPGAVGGVHYQQFPDPRHPAGAGPVLGSPSYEPALGGPSDDSALGGPSHEPALGGPSHEPALGGPSHEPVLGGPSHDPSRGPAAGSEPVDRPGSSSAEPTRPTRSGSSSSESSRPAPSVARSTRSGSSSSESARPAPSVARSTRSGSSSSESAKLAPSMAETARHSAEPTLHMADSARNKPEAEAERETRTGKHTVPDELVQAATYRLPPDRVFRAKVPNSTALPDEPTTNLNVPKPRRS